jgi:aspartate/methionine/tyrosine aminotransferase
MDEVEGQYKMAIEHGLNVKVFVIINPSNPTGHVMSKANLGEVGLHSRL